MTRSSSSKTHAAASPAAAGTPVVVHPAIRWGGAFIAIAVVLGVMVFITMSTQGMLSQFVVTPRLFCIVGAAALIGGFAPKVPGEQPTVIRAVALAIALLLVAGSRFIPNPELHVMEVGWLVAYAVAALLAGLVLRRSALRG